MREQSAEERAQSSLDIEYLLNNVVHKQIQDYTYKFGSIIYSVLGMNKDDLINDMREQIWKGLLTHKKDGQANLKTYLDTLIKNRFLLLYNRSTLRKYNSVEYHSSAFEVAGVGKEYTETEDTGETLLEKRQEFTSSLVLLSLRDRAILRDIILGFNLTEMVHRNSLTLPEVVSSINRIDETIKKQRLSE